MANEIIYSSADTDRIPVAVAAIAGIEKRSFADDDNRIVFTLSSKREIHWVYETSAARDTAFNKIITQYGFDV